MANNKLGENINKKAVVLLSGGLDSSTVLAMACSRKYQIFALTIFYGQRNNIELESAQKIAKKFGVAEHKIIDFDLRCFGGSSLTDNLEILSHDNISNKDIPNTYVPARNTIMLSLALAYAEVHDAQKIFFGANIHDYSGYPDCRPEYIKAYENMANLATRQTTSKQKISIEAPLVNLAKAEIIKTGISLGLDYADTHSCYDPKNNKACGLCSACFYRKKGFAEAGIKDPTKYN